MPITEASAYALAGHFYPAAARLPFGEAAQATIESSKADVPLYARLAFTAYGDPSFELAAMPVQPRVPMLSHACATWHSRLINHCTLRTEKSASDLSKALDQAPAPLAPLLGRWLALAFQRPPAADEALLSALEQCALHSPGPTDVERLSVHAAVLAERLHASGLETIPLNIATDAGSIQRLLADARFLALLGAVLPDFRLNGLGHSLMGRIITVDQNDASKGALVLREAREKLRECEDRAPFVQRLRADDARILVHFGLEPGACRRSPVATPGRPPRQHMARSPKRRLSMKMTSPEPDTAESCRSRSSRVGGLHGNERRGHRPGKAAERPH